MTLSHDEILGWLREEDLSALEHLWARADLVRRESVGPEVHLRGLIEISNYCSAACLYCGLRRANHGLPRYRMDVPAILECAREAKHLGFGTVVLQAGEDPSHTTTWVADLVRAIRRQSGLAITLSLGERAVEDLAAWKAAGADRYLLRFETSNPALFRKIHPGRFDGGHPRIALLRELRTLGFEVGSGVMIGIPGQSYVDLARDLSLFAQLDLDMIGVGPYLPHPATPLGTRMESFQQLPGEQAPSTVLMTCKVVALARLLCPHANIPATTALATLDPARGRELALMRGANVIMPNLTPAPHRLRYEIYPNKACLRESATQCNRCISTRIRSIGRTVGNGRGDSPNWLRRQPIIPNTIQP